MLHTECVYVYVLCMCCLYVCVCVCVVYVYVLCMYERPVILAINSSFPAIQDCVLCKVGTELLKIFLVFLAL